MSEQTDQQIAGRVHEAIDAANQAVLAAIRAGLRVELEVLTTQFIEDPHPIPAMDVRVSRVL